MSNKPNIFATCPAGCLWETVHKDDFLRSASIVRQYPNESGEFKIETGRAYWIKNSNAVASWGITVSLSMSAVYGGLEMIETTIQLTLPEFDKFADGIKFKFLGFDARAEAATVAYDHEIFAVYEYNGERIFTPVYTKNLVDTKPLSLVISTLNITVTGATDVFVYNEDAQIELFSEAKEAADRAEAAATSAEAAANSAAAKVTETEIWVNKVHDVVRDTADRTDAAAETAAQSATEATEAADRAEAAAQAAAEVGNIVQTTGDSPTAVMSQKATTELAEKITEHTVETFTTADCPFEGYIYATGIFLEDADWCCTDYIPVNEGATIKSNEIIGMNAISSVAYYDADKVFISSVMNTAEWGRFVIETVAPQNAKYVRLSFDKTDTDAWIRIDEWAKTTTRAEIEQIVSDYIPKTASRNLMTLTFKNGTRGRDDHSFINNTSGVSYAASPDYIEVIPNETYTLSWKKRDTNSYMEVYMYDESKTFIKMVAIDVISATHFTVTAPEGCYFISPSFYWDGTPWQELLLEDFQMEQGTEATPYVLPMVIDDKYINTYVPKTQFDVTPYGLPILEFKGNISEMNKDNAVTLNYKYGDREGSCTLKWQGSSSLAHPKKNYTVKFDNAFEAKEDWGEQKKYCLKANYIDFSHSRNICCAKLWGGVVKSRAVPNARLNALVNGGAIDGFPICVVINGEYKGIYTFNIPKDGWMFGMGSGNNEAILCADSSATGGCTFDALATLEQDLEGVSKDFELEYVSDENNDGWVKTSVNNLIQACMSCQSETDFNNNVAPLLDVDSAIDYYIFCALTQNYDGINKNYLLSTYDGTKWFFSAYDLDSTFGLWWDGSTFIHIYGYDLDTLPTMHRIFNLIKLYKADALKARYEQLVADFSLSPLGEEVVVTTFTQFASLIPKALLDEEVKMWTALGCTSTNNVSQIIDHYRRLRKQNDFVKNHW